MNTPVTIIIASKRRKPIIEVFMSKLPPNAWVTMGNRKYGGEPLYQMYTDYFIYDDLTIKEDRGYDEGAKDVIYYKRLDRNVANGFASAKEIMEFLVKGLKTEGAAVIYDQNSNILSMYDGKSILTKEKAKQYFYKLTVENNSRVTFFSDVAWFDLVREQLKNVQDDFNSESVSQLYDDMYNNYLSIKGKEYRNSIIKKLSDINPYPAPIEIAGKSFGIYSSDATHKANKEYLKRLIEERGGFVAVFDFNSKPITTIDDKDVVDRKEDYFITLDRALHPLISLSQSIIISEIDIWATLLDTDKLSLNDAAEARKLAQNNLQSADGKDHIQDYIDQKEKEYKKKIEVWARSDVDPREIMLNTRLSERQINRINFDAEVDFRDKYFVCMSTFGIFESTANRLIKKAVEERGGEIQYKAKANTSYTVLTEPYVPDVVKTIMEDSYGCSVITDIQFWRAATNEKNHVYTADEIAQIKKERDEREQAKLEHQRAERQRIKEEAAAQKEAARLLREQKKKEAEAERVRKKEQVEEEKRTKALAREKKKADDEKERQRKATIKQEKLQAEQDAKAKAAKEREQKLHDARSKAKIKYLPGEEPEKIRLRITTLLKKLEEAYPDHVIVNLGKEHKHWDETVTELYKLLGYADRASFFEAYGFKMNSDKGGRPTTLDPKAVIEELKRRYPEGTTLKMTDLISGNKDLPIKTLQNNATEVFGVGLGKYLKQIGILKQ